MKRDWRRTSFARLDGFIEVAPDDWTLFDDNGRPLARTYHYRFGPNAGRWAWSLLVGQERVPASGGTGLAETGHEACEACERRLPIGVQEALFLPNAESRMRDAADVAQPRKQEGEPPRGVRFLDLRHDQCRFPLGGIDAPVEMFCGRPIETGQAYCPSHCAVAYVKAPRRP